MNPGSWLYMPLKQSNIISDNSIESYCTRDRSPRRDQYLSIAYDKGGQDCSCHSAVTAYRLTPNIQVPL